MITEECARRGLSPILAGRDEAPLRPLAERLGISWRVFPLERPDAIARELDDVDGVLLVAGPFSHTSAPMLEACLNSHTHYVDITGEIAVLEAVLAHDADARAADCVVLPAVGFDVVPTDCLAASLARALPEATHLELAFFGIDSAGPGTVATMLEGLDEVARCGAMDRSRGCRSRGRSVSSRSTTRRAPRSASPGATCRPRSARQGFRTSRCTGPSRRAERAPCRFRRVFPLLRAAPVHRVLRRLIERRVSGPDETARARGRSELWACVSSGDRAVEGTASGPDAYTLTVRSSLESVMRVLGGRVPPGAWTPSTAFGPTFFAELEACTLRIGEPTKITRPVPRDERAIAAT